MIEQTQAAAAAQGIAQQTGKSKQAGGGRVFAALLKLFTVKGQRKDAPDGLKQAPGTAAKGILGVTPSAGKSLRGRPTQVRKEQTEPDAATALKAQKKRGMEQALTYTAPGDIGPPSQIQPDRAWQAGQGSIMTASTPTNRFPGSVNGKVGTAGNNEKGGFERLATRSAPLTLRGNPNVPSSAGKSQDAENASMHSAGRPQIHGGGQQGNVSAALTPAALRPGTSSESRPAPVAMTRKVDSKTSSSLVSSTPVMKPTGSEATASRAATASETVLTADSGSAAITEPSTRQTKGSPTTAPGNLPETTNRLDAADNTLAGRHAPEARPGLPENARLASPAVSPRHSLGPNASSLLEMSAPTTPPHPTPPDSNVSGTTGSVSAHPAAPGPVPHTETSSSPFVTPQAHGPSRLFGPMQIIDAVRQIALSASQGHARLDLQLEPEHLGKLYVSLQTDAARQLIVHITAEQSTSLHVIQQHLPQLRAALESQGMNPGAFSLSAGMNGEGQMSDHSEQRFDQAQSSRRGIATGGSAMGAEHSVEGSSPTRTPAGRLSIHV